MVLHGNPQEVTTDVCEVGKAIKLKFNGVSDNMFSALSKKGEGREMNGGL
jgi:hypothetical protein